MKLQSHLFHMGTLELFNVPIKNNSSFILYIYAQLKKEEIGYSINKIDVLLLLKSEISDSTMLECDKEILLNTFQDDIYGAINKSDSEIIWGILNESE